MRIKLLFIVFCWCNLTYAQHISLQGGWDMPSGNYSNAVLTKNDNGFAQGGPGYALTIAYPLKKNVGLSIKLGNSNQDFNANSYASQLAANNAYPAIQISMLSGYKTSYALLGVYSDFVKKNWTFQLHAAAGYVTHRTPSYKIAYTYNSNQGNDYTEAQTLNGIAFNWGVQARSQLSKHVTAGMYLDNLSATLNRSGNGYISSNASTYEFKFEVYQLGACVGYQF